MDTELKYCWGTYPCDTLFKLEQTTTLQDAKKIIESLTYTELQEIDSELLNQIASCLNQNSITHAFEHAYCKYSAEAMRFLLDRETLSKLDKDKRALEECAQRGNLSAVKLLFERYPKYYKYERTEAFIEAVSHNRMDVVRYFVEEQKMNVNKHYDSGKGWTMSAFESAKINKHVDMMAYLVSKGAVCETDE